MKKCSDLTLTSKSLICAILLSPVCFIQTHAASVSASIDPVVQGSAFNLTEYGDLDWAYWDTALTGQTSIAAANEKSGGTAISSMTFDGGNSVRGTSSSVVDLTYSFTDGTSIASGSIDDPTGVFNNNINNAGRGVQFSVTLPTTDLYTIYVWGAGFEVDEATMTANLTGAGVSDTIVTSAYADGGAKEIYLYTISAQADSANDVLDISLVMTQDGAAGSSHVLISGAAISAIPEPATAALLVSGLALVVTMARRRQR